MFFYADTLGLRSFFTRAYFHKSGFYWPFCHILGWHFLAFSCNRSGIFSKIKPGNPDEQGLYKTGSSEACNLVIFTKCWRWGRQHLRVGVENRPPGSERGVNFHFFTPQCHPVWVWHCDSDRQSSPLHPEKGPRTCLILKRSSQASRESGSR